MSKYQNNKGQKASYSKTGKPKGNMSKRTSSKDQRRSAELADTALKEFRSESNPYSWYANFPNFAKDVGTLSFSTPVGQPMYIKGSDFVANAGIMTLWTIPTPGYSVDMTSAINRQTVRAYTYLRSVQRAAATYDAADLMIYLMAVDSLYAYWAYLRRAYGVAQLFTPTNKYYPRRLLQAMGIDPSIANNLADFRAFINRFALNIGRFAAPKQFDIFERHQWMFSGLYLDGKTSRAQTYMFCPAFLYQYDNTVTTGSQLNGIQIGSYAASPTMRDLTSLQTIANNLLQAMENDEDTMNISGDLYRAYGDSGMYSVAETPDNYAIVPIYDETVLSQIENAVIVGKPTNDPGSSTVTPPTISQNPSVNNGAITFKLVTNAGELEANGKYYHNYPVVTSNKVMNFHWDNPTPEQVMEASRLMSGQSNDYDVVFDTPNAYQITTMPADVVSYVDVCITSLSNPAGVQFLHVLSQSVYVDITTNAILNTLGVDLMAVWEQFDWAPMIYVVKVNSTSNTADMQLMAADVDVFSLVSFTQLQLLNEAAMLSLLDSPQPVRA